MFLLQAVITRLIWTIWTSLSAVQERPLNLLQVLASCSFSYQRPMFNGNKRSYNRPPSYHNTPHEPADPMHEECVRYVADGKHPIRINSLGPSDAIWRWRSWSTLVPVMACCLTAPSHYLSQCWLIISEVQWHSYQGNFTRYLNHQSLKSLWKLCI